MSAGAEYAVGDGLAARRYRSPREGRLTAIEAATRDLAYRLRGGDAEAVKIAAAEMAPLVPAGAQLIPIPDSQGSTLANRALAEELARVVGGTVHDVLRRREVVESSRERSLRGERRLVAGEHGFVVNGAVPAGDVYYVDNVVVSDGTFDGAREAVGKGRGVAFARAPHGRIREQHVRRAFRGARLTRLGESVWSVRLPNGAVIRVEGAGTIAYDVAAFEAGYGRPKAAGEELLGSWRVLDRGGIVTLAKERGNEEVLDHEVFHAAMDLALTRDERASVIGRWGSLEAAADAYAAWNPRLAAPDTLFAKIREFFRRIVLAFAPAWERTFEAVRRGDAWRRPVKPVPQEHPVVVRSVELAEVEGAWREAWGQGKHGDEPGPRFPWAPRGDKWLEVLVPAQLVSASWDPQLGGANEGQVETATRYARRRSSLPPGVAVFGEGAWRLGARRLFLVDGNHRALAATFRGEGVRVFVPRPDWERFVLTGSAPGLRYATAAIALPAGRETGERAENLWRWIGDSQVTDEAGWPRVVYHGTPATSPIEAFDESRQDAGALYGPGIYCTESPMVAAGRAEQVTEWRYHDTEDGARNDPERVGFHWRDDTSGKWIALVPAWRTSSRGYAHALREDAIDPPEVREQVYGAMVTNQTFAKAMDAYYLTPWERAAVHRILGDYLDSGRRRDLGALRQQPYNVNVWEALDRAGLDRSGGVLPLYLRIEKPFRCDAPLRRRAAEKILDALVRLSPPSPVGHCGCRAFERESTARRIAAEAGFPDAAVRQCDDGSWEALVPNEGARLLKESILDRYEDFWDDSVLGETVYKDLTSDFQSGKLGDRQQLVRQALEAAGYDGIVYTGGRNTGMPAHRVWVAFYARQVKSAIGNRGTYARDDARIAYAARPSPPVVERAYRAGVTGPVEGVRETYQALGRSFVGLDIYLGRLEREIDRAYARGDHDLGATREAEAEQVRAAMEEMCCEQDPRVAEHQVATPIEDEVGRPSVEEQLAARYQEFLHFDDVPKGCWSDRTAILENMRGALEESGCWPRGEVADREILAAAADCYERFQGLRERYRERGDPGALEKAQAWISRFAPPQKGPMAEARER